MRRWNVWAPFFRPKGMDRNSKRPCEVIMAVFGMSAGIIGNQDRVWRKRHHASWQKGRKDWVGDTYQISWLYLNVIICTGPPGAIGLGNQVKRGGSLC
jgi:hypothetical protein